MNARVAVSIVGGLALTWAGCGLTSHQGSEDGAEPIDMQALGLQISEHDAQSLVGSFASEHGTISFEARALDRDRERAELSFTINGQTLGYEALTSSAQHDGFYRVIGDITLAPKDATLARQALDALIEELGDDVHAMSLFEASVPKMASFLADHPNGKVVPSISRAEYSGATTINKRLNDDATVCIKKNSTVTANYDEGKSGKAHAVSVVVGSNWGTSACGSGNYACMGRCGAGCGGFGGAWTVDCLDHDACSHNLCARGGSGDANCGDEYRDAQSEIFAGCSG